VRILDVLIGFEYSAEVRDAFALLGHNAWSCDLLPSEKPGNHYQGNIRDILYGKHWDIGIFFPPCTRLCNSGVRWLRERDLWKEMKEGAKLFKEMLDAPIDKVAIENPIPHKYALAIIGRKYDQIIQPWQFGHGETKATCLWLKNLPLLQPTDIVNGREQKVHLMSPGTNRGHERARTYGGVAKAMANQWSKYIIRNTGDLT
jgi:hypothetical protein